MRLLMDYVAEKGCKNGYVMWPVRTAVSGKQMTPAGATEIMEILGKEESICPHPGKAIEIVKQGSMSDQVLKHLTESQSRAIAHRERTLPRAWQGPAPEKPPSLQNRTKYLVQDYGVNPPEHSGDHLYQSCCSGNAGAFWSCHGRKTGIR